MASVTLGDNWPTGLSFRLLLQTSKRERLAELAAGAVSRPCICSVAECGHEGMPVLLIEAELQAIVCPVHQLVLLDGSPVVGEPVVATTVW